MFFNKSDKNIINSLDNIIDYLNNKTNIIDQNNFKSSRKNIEVKKRLDLINKNRWSDETYTMAEFLELRGDVEEIKIE
jgi:hypothetical protein